MTIEIMRSISKHSFFLIAVCVMIIYPPANFLGTALNALASNDIGINNALARGYYDDDAYLRGEEEGIPAIAYVLLWVVICAGIAFIFRVADKLNQRDQEETDIIFSSVILASGMGALYGFAITLGIMLLALIVDAILDFEFFEFVTKRTNLTVLFFAAVNVGSMNYLLRHQDDVRIVTKDFFRSYHDVGTVADEPESSDNTSNNSAKKQIIPCKQCGKKLRIPEKKKGKVTCPKCSSSWFI